ncbi:MAG: helix-hairpin-helix domain-containing protein, partial [Bacillota bacterium]|nr:helix-hairpin-helix domain-containing protein [Bacillota bacterium]
FVVQHYPETAWIPPEILISVDLPDLDAVVAWLRTLRQGRCIVRKPLRGNSAALLQMAQANAAESLRRHTLQGGNRQSALQETIRLLAEVLELEMPLHRIEAIDISHMGYQDQAAGLVVFQEGRPLRKHYRHFRLDPLKAPDDYEAMRQTLRRRLHHLEDQSFGDRPDLILADGGIGQVNALSQVLDEMAVKIPVAGIVKDERHRTRGLVNQSGKTIELRTQPGSLLLADGDSSDYAIESGEKLALLRLLTAIQDEAHRFAGRYRTGLHHKRQTRFTLEGIAGIGPARRRLLLQQFQTIKKIADASLEDLLSVKGLSEQAARSVYQHFHP